MYIDMGNVHHMVFFGLWFTQYALLSQSQASLKENSDVLHYHPQAAEVETMYSQAMLKHSYDKECIGNLLENREFTSSTLIAMQHLQNFPVWGNNQIEIIISREPHE